jgi:hypothetical protein
MPDLNAILEFVKSILPGVLARHFAAGIVALGAVALGLKTIFSFDWLYVVESALFLSGLTVALWYWIIVILYNRNAPSLRWWLYLGTPILLLSSGVTLFGAVLQSQYEYNDIGFYQSRHWKLASDGKDQRTFSADVIAVNDLSTRPFLVTATIDPACSSARLVDFDAKLASDAPYMPKLTEETDSIRSGETRRWRIEGFQPPAKLSLYVVIRNAAEWRDNCFHYNVKWEGK